MLRTIAAAFAFVTLTAGAAAASTVVTVETERITSRADAAETCSMTAASSVWTGHWNTTEWGRMSVCNCAVGTWLESRFDVEAGPIWNQRHAQRVCPSVCGQAQWTGDYARGRGSACAIAYPGHIRGRIEVGAPARVPSRPLVLAPTPRRPVAVRIGVPSRRVGAPWLLSTGPIRVGARTW